MTASTVIAAAVIAAAVVFAIISIIKRHREGKTLCGGDCSACGANCEKRE